MPAVVLSGPPHESFAAPRMFRRRHSATPPLRPLVLGGIVLLLSLMASDWIAGASIVVLWLGWLYLSREPGPPVVAAAFTHQWLQITIAVLYAAVTGRQVRELRTSDYRPMVLIGLAALTALFLGMYLGAKWRRRSRHAPIEVSLLPVQLSTIVAAYGVWVVFSGGLQAFAWEHPELTQILLVLGLIRYALLFLLVSRLAIPRVRWGWILLVLVVEVAMGFTSFFADFRQPIALVAICIIGTVDRKSVRTWVAVALFAIVGVVAGITWTAVKPLVRREANYSQTKAERLRTVAQSAEASLGSSELSWKYHTDIMVQRMWGVYYPALAVARVPSVLPHENGALLWAVISHMLTPRFLFPDKPVLPSDSEKVRKYSGVWVSGREVMTSFAFGYAAESYVDFGVPLMFLPIFVFGFLMGRAHRFLSRVIRHTELRTATIVVIFWSSLCLFEVSWVVMVGLATTQIVVLGAAAIAVDRLLTPGWRRTPATRPKVYGRTTAA